MKLKNRFRKIIREKVKKYEPDLLDDLSKKIEVQLKVLTVLLRVKNILGFIPYYISEPRIVGYFEWCLRSDLNVFFPSCQNNQLIFCRVKSVPKVHPLRFFSEKSRLPKLGLLLVPGLAFDRNLNRLGMGGGFYDKFLQLYKDRFLVFGVCYSFQVIEKVPTDKWDCRMNGLITDLGICVSKNLYVRIQKKRLEKGY